MEQFDRARALYDDAERSHSQAAIDQMTTDLNAAIATMRPGNLPELEDLDELLPLLSQAKQQASPSAKLREAIDYVPCGSLKPPSDSVFLNIRFIRDFRSFRSIRFFRSLMPSRISDISSSSGVSGLSGTSGKFGLHARLPGLIQPQD